MAARLKSSVVIAKLLASEGFNDRVQNMVEKYWLQKVCNPAGRKKHRRLDRDVAEMCKKLTDGEKLVLGKFISMHKAMSFQTGLRIGLTAFACKHDKEYEVEEDARVSAAKTTTLDSSGVQDHKDEAQIVGGDPDGN